MLPEDFAASAGTPQEILDRQSAAILACHTINTIEYAKCELKHKALIEWAREVSAPKKE